MQQPTLQIKSNLKTKSPRTSKVSSKGQITLPKTFLDTLGIDSGGFISISLNGSKIEIINKKQNIKSKLDKIIGSVKPKMATSLSLEEQILEARNNHYNK